MKKKIIKAQPGWSVEEFAKVFPGERIHIVLIDADLITFLEQEFEERYEIDFRELTPKQQEDLIYKIRLLVNKADFSFRDLIEEAAWGDDEFRNQMKKNGEQHNAKKRKKIINRVIAREEIINYDGVKAKETVLYFPDYAANYGYIVCWDGAHGEAAISYFREKTKPAKKEEAEKLIQQYEELCNIKLKAIKKMPRNWGKTAWS